jgi:hypothetical protein
MGKNYSKNNASGKRRESDFYATPYSLTRSLLSKEKLTNDHYEETVLEPACGNGAITKVLAEFGYEFTAYDKDVDFLKEEKRYDVIITNPPYSLSMEFIRKAKEVSKKFYFLLPLNYLHGKQRYDEVYSDKKFPLSKIWIFTRYIDLATPLRDDGLIIAKGMSSYMWAKWDIYHHGAPSINWINIEPYIFKNKTY